MKKVSLMALTATVLASTAVLAQTPPNCPKAFQGFFLGGNVGLGVGTGSHTFNLYQTPVGGTIEPAASHKNRLGIKGFDGGLNLGYNYRTGNWGLGLEFVANWTTSKGNLTIVNNLQNASISSSARLNNSLQLRGNFSYIIANLVAPKFIIGWDSSNFKLNTDVAGVVTDANGNAVPFNTERSKYLNGFLIGLGVDFLATKHFIIGIDTTVSMFNKSTFTRQLTSGDTGTVYTHTSSFKPEPYVKSSLIFKFIY